MSQDRKVLLGAALIFYDTYHKSIWQPTGDNDEDEQREQRLEEECAEAQARLRRWREARAARLALDTILPGWFYIDASDHLAQKKWNTFVSDSYAEWEAWLLANGVSEKAVEKLIEEDKERREQGRRRD